MISERFDASGSHVPSPAVGDGTLPFRNLEKFWKRMEAGGRKSFTYDEIDKTYQIRASRDILVHYLETIQKDLTERDTAQ